MSKELIINPKHIPLATVNQDEESNSKIVKILLEQVAVNKHYTLTSNQIGYTDNKICVVNVGTPIILINPEITSYDNHAVESIEADPSFPQKVIPTLRSNKITVKADNLKEETTYGCEINDLKNKDNQTLVQQAIFIQHAVDMLNGKSMYTVEYKAKGQPIVNNEKKIQRNDRVVISKTGCDDKHLKYKQAKYFIDNDGWQITKRK